MMQKKPHENKMVNNKKKRKREKQKERERLVSEVPKKETKGNNKKQIISSSSSSSSSSKKMQRKVVTSHDSLLLDHSKVNTSKKKKKKKRKESKLTSDEVVSGTREESEGFITLTPSKSKEVTPVNVPLVNTPSNIQPPWIPQDGRCGYSDPNIFFRLHEEILDFYQFINPTEIEKSKRMEVQEFLNAIITYIWPKATLKIFGSQLTELYLPNSDIDFVVVGAPEGKGSLFYLGDALRDSEMIHSLQIIAKARIPIVKFVHKETGIQADVCLNINSGLESGKLIQDQMRKYSPFRPLILTLKYFLMQRQLNETYQGGIGSYMLQMMVIAFLQQFGGKDETEEYIHRNMQDLGHLLYGFFEFYGQDLNFTAVGISIRNGGQLFAKQDCEWHNPERPYLLSVENPLDFDLDIGKNSYDILRVRKAFSSAYLALRAEIFERGGVHTFRDRKYMGSLLEKVIAVDQTLSNRIPPKSIGFPKIRYISENPKKKQFSRSCSSDWKQTDQKETSNSLKTHRKRYYKG